jgi:cytoskeletal protein CcmA (bactofilin family)
MDGRFLSHAGSGERTYYLHNTVRQGSGMGLDDRKEKEAHGGFGERWLKVSSAMRSFVKPQEAEPPQLSPTNGKETEMLKMGTREEKDFSFEQSGTGISSGSMGSTGSKTSGGDGTLIGEHISIEGTIRADEDIVIDGSMKGTIEVKTHQLTVGPKGKVEADVTAESVVISGRMTGNIIARSKVLITKNADFSGQIKAKRIAVEDGAYIKASIELEREGEKAAPGAAQRPIDAMTFGASDPSKTSKIDVPKTQAAK